MTKPAAAPRRTFRHSDFGFLSSFVICLWPHRFMVRNPCEKRKWAFHEPTDSGTGVSPVRTRRPTHGRDDRATSLRAGPEVGAPTTQCWVPMHAKKRKGLSMKPYVVARASPPCEHADRHTGETPVPLIHRTGSGSQCILKTNQDFP